MAFIDSVIMTRARVRSITVQAIPEEVLNKKVRAGMSAPSAVNVQPWEKDDVYARLHWIEDCSEVSENIPLAVHSVGYGAVWTAVYPNETRIPKEKYNQAAVHFNKW